MPAQKAMPVSQIELAYVCPFSQVFNVIFKKTPYQRNLYKLVILKLSPGKNIPTYSLNQSLIYKI